MIRLAKIDDFNSILDVYKIARTLMKETGNPNQWGDNRPTEEAVLEDIKASKMYVIEENTEILGVFSLQDVDYDYVNIDGKWLNDEKYIVIHKVASSGNKKGIFSEIINYVYSKTKNIRIDTHEDNKVMQKLLVDNGFTYCGVVFIERKLKRRAYHLVIKK
ncbi:hypothetical protein [Helcococcus bovis]|uniref:N-acetyltransferase domain-containing protein n=1 Tax=Helcococcus bovis TaxID=3153252 RepID=A0ABW9F6B9_9FIRM